MVYYYEMSGCTALAVVGCPNTSGDYGDHTLYALPWINDIPTTVHDHMRLNSNNIE